MADRMVLYVGERNVSSWSMRAHVLLKLKGLDFEERTIRLLEDPDRSRRREIGPTGRVPVLRHAGRVIPDSLAILEYLEETFPPPEYPALWPTEPGARAGARWLAAEMHAGYLQLREAMSFHLCFHREPPRPPAGAMAEAAEMLALWEAALEQAAADGPFLFGEFGGVDAMYAPAVVRLTAFGVPTADTPRAAAYMPKVLEHPCVRSWMDEARALPPVDFEP